MTTQDPLDHDLAAYIRSKGRWPEREHNPLADGLRAVFMERGWTIQMDDRPGQPLDPFPFLDRLVRAALAATPPAIDPERGPRTEAGRMLAALGNGDEPIRPDDWLGIILDIEAQAAATPPAIDPERLLVGPEWGECGYVAIHEPHEYVIAYQDAPLTLPCPGFPNAEQAAYYASLDRSEP